MKYSRNKLQELAVICVYQHLFYNSEEKKVKTKEILEQVTELKYEKIDSFLKLLFKSVILNINEIVDEISANLVDWEFKRLNKVEQAILLCGYAQTVYMEQPKTVAIDVSVELAKKYGGDESYKYINGVLDKCLKDN